MELLLRRRSKPVPALEFIDFQHDSTATNIEASVTIVAEKIKSGIYKKPKDLNGSKEIEGLASLLLKRFGLKFSIICDEVEAAIFPFQPNPHSIMTHPYNWGGSSISSMMSKAEHLKTKGTVNTKEAYVTGIFSEQPSMLYINFHTLLDFYKQTVPEITAIILHEVGHAFYSCEFSDRMESTNQILANVFREVTDRKEKADMKYVYREIKRLNPEVEETEIDALVDGNKIIAGYNWFKLFVGVIRSQMPNYLYDDTSFEASADNFASRFGYGRELISGLDRMEKKGYQYIGPKMQIFSYIHSLVVLGVFVSAWVSSLLLLPISTTAMVSFYVFIGLSALIADNSETFWFKEYDETKNRYIRIRQDSINLLKSPSVPKKQALETIETIKAMDEFIKETGMKKSVFSQLAYLISSGERNAVSQIEIQRTLEALTSSDLFLKAAELKTS